MTSAYYADQDEVLEEFRFTMSQSKALSIATRIAATFSLAAAVYMGTKAFQNRDRMYHRLTLAMSLHLIVYSFWYMYGSAAVPPEYSTVWRARGTVATCTAQGFFTQITLAIPFYYGFLSLYSLQAVRHNFDITKYQWIEKWIHICAHVFPIGSAFYLLHIEAYNPSGHFLCWIASVPFGCGKGSGTTCDRGPQNIEQIAWIFAGLPGFFFLLFPTVVMIVLYLHVRRRQLDSGRHSFPLDSKVVARQAGCYLLGVYWTYVFTFINNGIQWIGKRKVYATAFLAVVNINLMGVWILLVYRYFRIVMVKQVCRLSKGSRHRTIESQRQTTVSSTFIPNADTKESLSVTAEPATPVNLTNKAGTSEQQASSGLPLSSSTNGATQPPSSDGTTASLPKSLGRRFAKSLQDFASSKASVANDDSNDNGVAAFNIFDGTNATGAFAQYIFDGDSEDEAEDRYESNMWGNVQDHI